ncbi:penicillin-sensitive transpeptidase [Saccharobesus litoralis]|uniref:Penicillin-binding protein 1A n=1 Tax=Saccharobesus litoralis TaxID=2172099 RepID=A0A2S0VXS8_9ALTE|nr:penicillin-sensitive transpeptidase [Saccharobesus litoralis]
MYYYIKDELPSVEVLQDVRLQTPMRVYTSDGKLISQFGEKKRIPITLQQTPDHFIKALLAAEDSRFYEHPGVDFVGLVRSAVAVVAAGGRRTQGASTLTMQLARNFFLTREKTYIRKIKEIFIAFHIESLLSKDEILTLYLNKNELGNRAFGFGAVAEVLYGKTIEQVTIPESAMMVGLLKAPSKYNPLRRPILAKQRRDTVLWRMKEEKYLSESEYQAAINTPLTAKFHGAQIEVDAPYIAEMVRQHMVQTYGDEAYTGGYQVYTTISSRSQQAAQHALRLNTHAYDERHGYRYDEIEQLWQPLEPKQSLTDDKPAINSETINEANEQTLTTQAVESDVAEEDPTWSHDELQNKLKTLPEFGLIKNAVVMSIDTENDSFTFIDQDKQISQVSWHDAKWARPYISDTMQGKEPNSIQDVVQVGQLIKVRRNQNNDGWRLAQLPDVAAALVSLDPDNGAVRALIGGYDFRMSEYNRVTQAKRQVGSNIKPFIYSAALENGFTLASIINDAPINQWDRSQGITWRPKNSPPVYDGPIRMRRALAESKNVVSVRLLRSVGINKVVEQLAKFGFDPNDIPRAESIALGSASFTPLEVATAYTTFANGGHLVTPYVIETINNEAGDTIWQANPPLACLACRLEAEEQAAFERQLAAELSVELNDELGGELNNELANESPDNQYASLGQEVPEYLQAKQVISEQNAFLIAEAMKSTIWGGGSWRHKTGWNGTAWRAQKLKRRDIGGKTGTTNDAKDAWFSGFTPQEVITSWVGFDDHTRVLGKTKYNNNLGKDQIFGTEFGAKTALPAWIDYAQVALDGVPKSAKQAPANIITVRIDQETGKLSSKTDHSSRFEYFIEGTEPHEFIDNSPSPDVLTAELDGEVSEAVEEGIF